MTNDTGWRHKNAELPDDHERIFAEQIETTGPPGNTPVSEWRDLQSTLSARDVRLIEQLERDG